MLAVVAVALAAADLAKRAGQFPDAFALLWATVSILVAAGTAEYAFEKRWLPLGLWRFVAPAYALYIAYSISKVFRPESPVVIAICGAVFLAASVVAIARRAKYLGAERIPFGGRNPSLT